MWSGCPAGLPDDLQLSAQDKCAGRLVHVGWGARPRLANLPPVVVAEHLNVKLFADGADLEQILRLAADERVRGFTTNPTLMWKAGLTDYAVFCRRLLEEITDRPISFEVF